MKKILSTNINVLSIILIILFFINALVIKTDQIIPINNINMLSSNIQFNDWKDEDYWEWHTRTTTDDRAYNGNHIQIKEDVIDFYGYGVISYKDFLYKDYKNSGKKIFKFIIDESKANYHTLEGAGLLFNANIINNKLSGYILLFTKNNLELYRLDDVDTNTFENTSNTKISTYGRLIKSVPKTNSKLHSLVIQASPTNITVNESGNEILNENLDMSIHIGEGFGLISSYVQHNCSILSTIEFSDFGIEIVDYEIFITNVDENKNPIPNKGYFQLLDENNEVVREGYVDENGKFNIDGLQEGTYELKQVITPIGYEKNEKIIEIKISVDGKIINDNNEEIKIDFINKKIDDKENTSEDEAQDNGESNLSKDEEQGDKEDVSKDEGQGDKEDVSKDEGQGDKEDISKDEGQGNQEDTSKDDGKIDKEDVPKDGELDDKKNNKLEDKDSSKTENIKKHNSDNTIANKIIPRTGKEILAVKILLLVFFISSIYSFIKLKSSRYKF